MNEPIKKSFFFGNFELNGSKRLLLKDGATVSLNSKTFDLLLFLVENRGEILSKDRLLDAVWEGNFVEENNLTVQISALRKVFAEKKDDHKFIATVPGKGYKFIADVDSKTLDANDLTAAKTHFQHVLHDSSNDRTALTDALVGRAREIAEIENLLKSETINLVTLTGAGGAGKTSLARAIEKSLREDFPDGVFFVELAALSDPKFVAPTLIKIFGAAEAAGHDAAEILKNFLSGKKILLILDNYEQIIRSAPLVGELLAAAPALKVLVTSRIALRIRGEREFSVAPLSVPPPQSFVSKDDLGAYAAVELFLKQAQKVRPNFALNDENADVIAGICRRLDGLPLALELAAARVKLLSPASIFSRLENSLDLLAGNLPDAPARQRTIREAIRWSYDLLESEEKAVFRRIAVFAGGFTVEAAEAVVKNVSTAKIDQSGQKSIENQVDSIRPTAATLDSLTSLAENNLLIIKEQPKTEDARLSMLEVVREFALERLEESGEIDSLKASHAHYFLSLAETADSFLHGATANQWLDKLEIEHDNLRAALSWALKNETEVAVKLAAALRFFWSNRSYISEGLSWSKTALAASEHEFSVARANLQLSVGLFLRNLGRLEEAHAIYEKCLAENIKTDRIEYTSKSFQGLGAVAVYLKNYDLAETYYQKSLKLTREMNNETQLSYTLGALGDLELCRGNLKSARTFFIECLELAVKHDAKRVQTVIYYNLGTVEFFEKRLDAAAANFIVSLRLAREIGWSTMIWCALEGFAALAVKNGAAEQSAFLAGAAEGLREKIGYLQEPAEEKFRELFLTETRAKLSEEKFSALYANGRAANLDEIIARLLDS